ncbi:MAG: PrsW family intramembrane metalloprotease [Actinomadura sp.]
MSPAALAALVISSGCTAVMLLIDAAGGPSFLTGLALAMLPVPVLISLILKLDPLEPEPWRALVFVFMWGAGVAILGAVILNELGLQYVMAPIFGPEKGRLVVTTVSAPLVEESLKGAVLFGYLRFYSRELDELTDGIIYGAMVAVGFAMMENIAYYMRAAASDELGGVFILRGVITPFGHPLFTALTGVGVAYAAMHRGTVRRIAPLAGLAAAAITHGAWNYSTVFGAYAIALCIVAILTWFVVRERRAMRGHIDTFLTPYVADGLVRPDDIQMLASPGWRSQARAWAAIHGGTAAARAMGYYQLAATELVLLHKMAAYGVTEPSWFDQRREALVELVRVSRETFQSAVSPAGNRGTEPHASGRDHEAG